MQHIIKKQVIHLSLDTKLDAFQIQQKVSSHFWHRVVPLLEQAFDAASNEEETISLDTLEIDLGVLDVKEIEKGDWESRVLKQITEQLLPVKHNLPLQGNVKTKSSSLSISGQWIFYMRQGYLPWNVLQIGTGWYDRVLEAFAGDATAIETLRDLINRHPASVKRITCQHQDNFLQGLVETLTAENQDALQKYINEMTTTLLPANRIKHSQPSKEKEVRQNLWAQVLQLAASAEKNLSPLKIASELLKKNFAGQQFSTKKIKDFLLKNQIDAVLLNKIKKEKDKDLNHPAEEISTAGLIGKDNRNEVGEEGIYVINAGIVLLHPFLIQFFRNLRLVGTGNFIDVSSHEKALYLLHYLATGNTHAEEHELVIAKILCEHPLSEPVGNPVELGIDELQEADSLLWSAIGQWEILKSTSPDGLREGFLQRKGKLFTKNGNLHLQVEASSIDVLLDHLPWNLSMVMLPWMKEILKVEWR